MRPPSVPSRSHGQRTGVETSSSAPPPLRAARLSFARTKAALDGLNRPESRRMSGSLGPHLMKGDGIGPSASVTNWSTAASTVRSADTSSLKAKYDSAKRRRDAIVRLCRRTMGRPRLQISAHGAQRSAVRAQRARRASRGRAYSNRRRSSAPTSEGLRTSTPSSTRAQCCTRGATADLRLPGRGAGARRRRTGCRWRQHRTRRRRGCPRVWARVGAHARSAPARRRWRPSVQSATQDGDCWSTQVQDCSRPAGRWHTP